MNRGLLELEADLALALGVELDLHRDAALPVELERAYRPRVALQGALFGRGSGADVPGQPSLGSGAWLQVPNWAVGATVTFPVFDVFPQRARRQVEARAVLQFIRDSAEQRLERLRDQIGHDCGLAWPALRRFGFSEPRAARTRG